MLNNMQHCLKEIMWRPKCLLAIQVNPKKGGKLRLVMDCYPVNAYLHTPKFKQEGISQVENIICEEDYFITLDLKDGFFHVPISEESSEFLGITWKNRFFVWQVLPFGLSSSPYFFYKVLWLVVNWACVHGIQLADFVDDFLVCASVLQWEHVKSWMVNLFTSLGWTLNYKKSVLMWSQWAAFMGYDITSTGTKGPWLKI